MISANYLKHFQSKFPKTGNELAALRRAFSSQTGNTALSTRALNREYCQYAMDLFKELQQGRISAGLPLYSCRKVANFGADLIPQTPIINFDSPVDRFLALREQETVCRFITARIDAGEARTRARLCTLQSRTLMHSHSGLKPSKSFRIRKNE
jgi:hypothetical protein